MKGDDLEIKAIEALRDVLKDVSFVEPVEERREAESASVHWDWQVQLRVLDQEVTLLVEVKNSGDPRPRDAVNQLLRSQRALPGHTNPDRTVGLSGSSLDMPGSRGGLCGPRGQLPPRLWDRSYRADREAQSIRKKRDLRSLYSPKASRILRVLLNDPRRPWKLQTLADEAEVVWGRRTKSRACWQTESGSARRQKASCSATHRSCLLSG